MRVILLALRALIIFVGQVLVSTIGVAVLTAFLTFSSYSMMHSWNHTISTRGASRLLTEVPGFPVQVLVALMTGFLIAKHTRSRLAAWAWIVPALAICGAFIWEPRTDASILSHYFGYGCTPMNRCFDQFLFTLPLEAAVSYALGATLSLRLYAPGSQRASDPVA